jgi:hypothetical protein
MVKEKLPMGLQETLLSLLKQKEVVLKSFMSLLTIKDLRLHRYDKENYMGIGDCVSNFCSMVSNK